MKFNFNYCGKRKELDVNVCRNIFSQGRGLMFRNRSKPLLFRFGNKDRRGIHSFFCQDFYAIWFNEGRIIDEKLVKPWRLSVKPQGKFDTLLEIPSTDKNFLQFVDEQKI